MSARAFKAIRLRLGVSQGRLGKHIGCTQGNISFYERGQSIPSEIAQKLIAFACGRGLQIDFNHVYGAAELPPKKSE